MNLTMIMNHEKESHINLRGGLVGVIFTVILEKIRDVQMSLTINGGVPYVCV